MPAVIADGDAQRCMLVAVSEGKRLRALLTKFISHGVAGSDRSVVGHVAFSDASPPAATDSNQIRPAPSALVMAGACIIPRQRAAPPIEHAQALLDALQGPGGRTGTIRADELQLIHRELCLERDFEEIGWIAVGRELRRLIGDRRNYDWIDGRRIRVYRIPPAESRPFLRIVDPGQG